MVYMYFISDRVYVTYCNNNIFWYWVSIPALAVNHNIACFISEHHFCYRHFGLTCMCIRWILSTCTCRWCTNNKCDSISFLGLTCVLFPKKNEWTGTICIYEFNVYETNEFKCHINGVMIQHIHKIFDYFRSI